MPQSISREPGVLVHSALKASVNSLGPGPKRLPGRMIDKYNLISLLGCTYVLILSPLLNYVTTVSISPAAVNNTLYRLNTALAIAMEPRPENRVVWPLLGAIAVALSLRNWSRLYLAPHIACLLAYLAFAGVSALWAYSPTLSFQRFVLQSTIIASIVIPVTLAARATDIIRGIFFCLAIACTLNFILVMNQRPILLDNLIFGYQGYFTDKNSLGACAAVGFLVSVHEIIHRGYRRMFGIFVGVIAIVLMIMSQSKTALGLAIFAPIFAALTLTTSKVARTSPAIVLLPLPILYWLADRVSGNIIVNRISWHVYENFTLSGRTYIWDFANQEIAHRPLLGWGYQSFWLAGPNAPSVVNAPGWIKTMPHAHNGYLDTMLEIGYVGLVLLVGFIVATLHAIGRVADRDLRRAWLLLSFTIFTIAINFLESKWMRGMDLVWVMFLVVVAEAGRYCEPSSMRRL